MSTPRPGVTRFATRQNARVAYDPGTAIAGDAPPPVVLLHDLLADRTAWTPLRAILANHRRVIVPDARGHGASPTLTNQWYTVAELAADLLAVLDAEQILAAHLVGHGLGAATAFELAHRHPARVHSLTLITPTLYCVLDNHPDPAVRSARNDLRTSDRAAADAAYKGLIDKALDTYLLPRQGANWRQTMTKPQFGAIRRHAAALSALLPALDAYTIDRTATRALTTRTLILIDAAAAAVDLMTADNLVDLLPNCRSARIDSSRDQQTTPSEAAQSIAAALSGFFEAPTIHPPD